MDFQKYNVESSKTMHTDFDMSLSYLILALNEESGEVAGVLKKTMRDHGGILDEKRRELILKELGDVLWYLNQIAEKLGSSLQEVAALNVSKLAGRKERGTLRGSGNNR
jgi:NTP pyrophosphatase (non-canonical NTP hydrolase)